LDRLPVGVRVGNELALRIGTLNVRLACLALLQKQVVLLALRADVLGGQGRDDRLAVGAEVHGGWALGSAFAGEEDAEAAVAFDHELAARGARDRGHLGAGDLFTRGVALVGALVLLVLPAGAADEGVAGLGGVALFERPTALRTRLGENLTRRRHL